MNYKKWKAFLFIGMLFAVTVSNSFAFLFEVPIKESSEVAQLSDKKLMDAYIDVIVELEATRTFYSKGGLTPKEYKKYKDLLRYRIVLIMEMQKRKIEVPKL